MLMKLHTMKWTLGLNIREVLSHSSYNERMVSYMHELTKGYNKKVREEEGKTRNEIAVASVGKVDPQKRLKEGVAALMVENIDQSLGTMVDLVIFH